MRHPGNGAGRAHGADEVGDAPFCVTPDLGAGGLEMRPRIVGIGELIEHQTLAIALHLLGQIAGVFHAAALGGEQQLGAEGFHGLGALDTEVFGHDEHHAITQNGGGHRQGDAGIARGGLDQRVAGFDGAALLRVANHGNRRPVFHRSGRVVAFELAQDQVAAPRIVGAGDALQLHQRGVADHLVDGEVGHGSLLKVSAEISGGQAVCGQLGPPQFRPALPGRSRAERSIAASRQWRCAWSSRSMPSSSCASAA